MGNNPTVNVPTTNNIVIYSDSNRSKVITTLNNVQRGQKYNQKIDLGTEVKETDTVYLRFSFSAQNNYGGSTNYNFDASVEVSDLVNGTTPITLSR